MKMIRIRNGPMMIIVNSDEEEDEKYYKKENRYNKYKDKELYIMNDDIRYKFEYNYKSHKKNEKFVFDNKNENNYRIIEEKIINKKERRISRSRSRSRNKNINDSYLKDNYNKNIKRKNY
jgi:hypothetical protein